MRSTSLVENGTRKGEIESPRIEHLTFNQGVTGSRPVRPTKLNRPSLPGSFEENQGVKTLGQPTPRFYRFYCQNIK